MSAAVQSFSIREIGNATYGVNLEWISLVKELISIYYVCFGNSELLKKKRIFYKIIYWFHETKKYLWGSARFDCFAKSLRIAFVSLWFHNGKCDKDVRFRSCSVLKGVMSILAFCNDLIMILSTLYWVVL
ncbi:hypothetical protein T12_15707 [Trichinella patagoniensis]|uniref:Uncharacterized protein n=1 Tax=Trichinella patagoniensis TaxID=990121 RepID=A0A0V0ZHE4_9BILA|nr:hypothetical protein T12_15707 [Trichinella patagoniensis]